MPAYTLRDGPQPGLPNATGAMCWFIATLHLLACHAQLLQALSDAIVTVPELSGVAAWVSWHAVWIGSAALSLDPFVLSAGRAGMRVTLDVPSDAYPVQTRVEGAYNAMRRSTFTDRAGAALVLALHLIGRDIVLTDSTAWSRLLSEAVLFRAAGDASALDAPHVFASPTEMLTVLFGSSPEPPPAPAAPRPALDGALHAHCQSAAFWAAAGVTLNMQITPSGCCDVDRTRLALIAFSRSPDSVTLQDLVRVHESELAQCTREVTFTRFLLCDVLGISPSHTVTGLDSVMETATGVYARVKAIVGRPIGAPHFVAFVRDDKRLDLWHKYDDSAVHEVQSVKSSSGYEIQCLLLVRVPAVMEHEVTTGTG